MFDLEFEPNTGIAFSEDNNKYSTAWVSYTHNNYHRWNLNIEYTPHNEYVDSIYKGDDEGWCYKGDDEISLLTLENLGVNINCC